MGHVPDLTGRQTPCTRSAASSSSPGPSRSNDLLAPYNNEPPARKRARREGWDIGTGANGRRQQEFTHSSVRENGRGHFGDHYGDIHYHNRDAGMVSHPNHEHKSDVFANIMESLRFEQMDVRQDTISRAHLDTCKWIFDRPEYIDWRNVALMSDHRGFLWIKSKPGAGKSTLMKFLLQTAPERLPDDKIISFFFNARGEELERSLEGCYRGLLHQLLTKIPRLHDALGYSKTFTESPRQWSLVSLREMFSEAILQLGEASLTCFIDALDECPEAEIRDMIDFFEELGVIATEKKINLRICMSSRYYPQISIANGRELRLDQQNGHQEDIAKYVKSKMKVGRGKTAEEIRAAVQEKAQGIFMWVVLVVRILNEERDHGRNNDYLRGCLEKIPGELHKLFQDILLRGIQDDQDLIPILQWISFSRRPLTREELYFAVCSGRPDFTPSIPWDPDEDSPEIMDLFILNASKGLAEMTKGKKPRIQFIHESVRDYLRETGFEILAPDLSVNLEGSTHDYIKDCCYRWISEEMEKVLVLPELLPRVSQVQELRALRAAALKKSPFLEYSVNNVLHHAELAYCGGIPQERFLEEFRWLPWVRINGLFAEYERDRYAEPADTLTYALATHRASTLLKTELRLHARAMGHHRLDAALRVILNNRDDQLFMAIAESDHLFVPIQLTSKTMQVAIKTQNLDLIRVILIRGLYDVHARDSKQVLRTAVETGNAEILQILLEEGAAINDTVPVFTAISIEDERILRVILAHGAVFDGMNRDGATPLAYACDNGRLAAAQLLIEHGACVNPRHIPLIWTPLLRACLRGHTDIARMLLEHNAAPNLETTFQGAPLVTACLRGHGDIARMLLEHGADPNVADDSGHTLLVQACRHGYEDIARMLLDHGADPNVADKHQKVPLVEACLGGHRNIARMLLKHGGKFEHGADPNVADESGRTLLVEACRHGCEDIARMLLDHDADPNVADKYQDVPLVVTCSIGNSNIARMLLAQGGNPNLADGIGRTPLLQAYSNGFGDMVNLLLEYGADVNTCRRTDLLASVYANKNFDDSLNALVLHGLDPCTDSDYLDTIEIASVNGREHVVRNLLDESTRFQHEKPDRYREVVQAVTMARQSSILELLLDQSEGFRAQDKAIYRGPLRQAEQLGFSGIVKVLRERGVTLPEDTAS